MFWHIRWHSDVIINSFHRFDDPFWPFSWNITLFMKFWQMWHFAEMEWFINYWQCPVDGVQNKPGEHVLTLWHGVVPGMTWPPCMWWGMVYPGNGWSGHVGTVLVHRGTGPGVKIPLFWCQNHCFSGPMDPWIIDILAKSGGQMQWFWRCFNTVTLSKPRQNHCINLG